MKCSRRKGIFILAVTVLVAILCLQSQKTVENNESTDSAQNSTFWGLGDSVSYVGMQTCGGCHVEIYQSFQHTGMGQSFGLANKEKSAGNFENHPVVHDSYSGFSYRVFWQHDTLKIQEYSIDDHGDTLLGMIVPASYIIGSGHHTNSHLRVQNGYVTQMPFTYYSQSQVWDLPPGFEQGANSRFSRLIGLECMSCHNAMPVDFVMGSENKFNSIPLGIDCERCHGPGSAHVAKIMRGDLTDTSTQIDYSIVNPKKLTPDLRFQICQRCHLQGNAVLKDGKSFLDFRPGMWLHDVMDVYAPSYSNEPNFIMASHADRLQQSQCFVSSNGKLDCVACHNPHVSVRKTNELVFDQACQQCHGQPEQTACSLPLIERDNKNCFTCHMPSSGTKDIPHVQIHDHRIAVRPALSSKEETDLKQFLGLRALNNKHPSLKSKIRGYLQQYERFEANPSYLDSLTVLFKGVKDPKQLLCERINFFYLTADKEAFSKWYSKVGESYLLQQLKKSSYDNADAWAAFKTAELLHGNAQLNSAQVFYERAIALAPFIPDMRLKYGNFLVNKGDPSQAVTIYQGVIKDLPYSEVAHGNLGYVYFLLGEYEAAKHHLQEALRINPSYTTAKTNLALVQ